MILKIQKFFKIWRIIEKIYFWKMRYDGKPIKFHGVDIDLLNAIFI